MDVKHMFVEVKGAKGSKITSTTPACVTKTDQSVSWICDGLTTGTDGVASGGVTKLVVPLPQSEIITSDVVTVVAPRLSYETVGPGERQGYESTSPLTPPLRYHAPIWPPVGPPVVCQCSQVPAHDVEEWLFDALTRLRLPATQRTAMVRFWLPMMLVHKFLLIRFLPDNEHFDRLVSKLSLLPQPASIRRVFMTWQGIEEKLDEHELDPMGQQQDLEAIARDSIKYYDVPDWPPVADPTMTDAQKMADDNYGYIDNHDGSWSYTLIIDEKKRPPEIDVVEWGGACLNELTPDVYALEMYKVTRV